MGLNGGINVKYIRLNGMIYMLPKKDSGLGFRDLECFYLAMLVKQG